jgi:hypothetical protein
MRKLRIFLTTILPQPLRQAVGLHLRKPGKIGTPTIYPLGRTACGATVTAPVRRTAAFVRRVVFPRA